MDKQTQQRRDLIVARRKAVAEIRHHQQQRRADVITEHKRRLMSVEPLQKDLRRRALERIDREADLQVRNMLALGRS